MKTVFTLLFSVLIVTAYPQQFKEKFNKADSAFNVKDSVSASIGGDTLVVDLLEYKAMDRLHAIDQQRATIQNQAVELREKLNSLDAQWNSILDGEARHDKRFDQSRKVLKFYVEGTGLVIIQEKKPEPAVPKKEEKKTKKN